MIVEMARLPFELRSSLSTSKDVTVVRQERGSLDVEFVEAR